MKAAALQTSQGFLTLPGCSSFSKHSNIAAGGPSILCPGGPAMPQPCGQSGHHGHPHLCLPPGRPRRWAALPRGGLSIAHHLPSNFLLSTVTQCTWQGPSYDCFSQPAQQLVRFEASAEIVCWSLLSQSCQATHCKCGCHVKRSNKQIEMLPMVTAVALLTCWLCWQVSISSQCASALDNLAGFYFKHFVAAEDGPSTAGQVLLSEVGCGRMLSCCLAARSHRREHAGLVKNGSGSVSHGVAGPGHYISAA